LTKPKDYFTSTLDFEYLQMITTVIFDFDGTITQDLELFIECYNQVAVRLKLEKLTDEKVLELKDCSIKEVLKGFKPKWKLPFLIFLLKRKILKRIKEVAPTKPMEDVIFQLKRKYSLGILSSNNKRIINRFLSFYHLNVFDFVVSERNLFGKAKALKKILKKRKLKPEEVVYIGDEVKDIEACHQIGVKIISVTWGFNSSKSLTEQNSGLVVTSPEQILDLVEN
jgi:phosphoglycolate phosphatase